MRILEVTHYMPPHTGGIERVAASLVEGLSRRGHTVRWIASATPRPPETTEALVRVPAWNILEERIGVPYPLWSAGALTTLIEQIHWADVVHVHDCLYMGSAAAALACTVARKPLLLTQHVGYVPFGPFLDTVQKTAYRTLGRTVLSRANRRVAVSAHVPEYFATLGVRVDFTVIPNAVDEQRFQVPSEEQRRQCRARWGIPQTAQVVLFVGRLVPKKGVSRVAHVQRTLAAEGITLLVVGDGPLTHAIAATPRTLHHRSVPPERMHELYALADVFLLPSHGEGLPLSVQEALMTGLPAVLSDDPAYISNLSGAPGVYCASSDADLIEGIRKSLYAPPSRETLSTWARTRWGRDRFITDYERIFTELVRNRQRRK